MCRSWSQGKFSVMNVLEEALGVLFHSHGSCSPPFSEGNGQTTTGWWNNLYLHHFLLLPKCSDCLIIICILNSTWKLLFHLLWKVGLLWVVCTCNISSKKSLVKASPWYLRTEPKAPRNLCLTKISALVWAAGNAHKSTSLQNGKLPLKQKLKKEVEPWLPEAAH